MSYEKLVSVIRGSFFETLVACALITSLFFALEPVVGRSASDTDTFTITQTVSGAIAFATDVTTVATDGTLNGLTGGTAYATATARVTTNNATGYNMTISFSSTTAMNRDSFGVNGDVPEILNYVYSTGTASYPSGFDTTVASAQFGFTVNASNTAEISDVFTNTGAACGTGNNGGFTLGTCWRGASSTNAAATTQLLNSSAPTPASGSTSTVIFRVNIPNGPSPSVPDGTYTATATLTATDN